MGADTGIGSGTPGPRRLAVVGAGWAGLAAAVRATQAGWRVSLFEMAHQPGGRARSVAAHGENFDNGQHILIGAYQRTLDLMATVGAPPDRLLKRLPLALAYPDGQGLVLPAGRPVPSFLRGVLAARPWSWPDKLALLRRAIGWRLRGFRCTPQQTVADLCAGLPPSVMADLVEPLCVAALNTPAERASATVFLRVLQDALFGAPGSADLLLPCTGLSDLLPTPACAWLRQHGADLRPGHRVTGLARQSGGWALDGEPFDAVVLACTTSETARLAEPLAPDWSATARALRHEPIVTVWLQDAHLRLPRPMLALRAGADAPAQFVFDLAALGGPAGRYAFVVSGAEPWLRDGVDVAAAAVVRQARQAFPGHFTDPACLRHVAAERRATFACTPGLSRPAGHLADGLWAAGDYIAGPYPATIEGAVRSGEAAVAALGTARASGASALPPA